MGQYARWSLEPSMIFELALRTYGFEGSTAAKIFMAGFVCVVILSLCFVRMPALLWMLLGVVFATALGAGVTQDRTGYLPTWILPVALRRPEIQLGGCIVILVALLLTGRLNLARLSPHAWFLLLIAFLAGTLQTIHTDAATAGQTIGFALVTVTATALASRYIVIDTLGAIHIVRMFLVAAALWAGASSIQFLINPELLVNANGRFQGVLSNPQLCGLWLAPVLTMALWGALNDPERRVRFLCFGLVGIYILFAGWTGSRLTAIMTLIGWAFVLWSKIGKLVLLLPFTAVLVYGLSILAAQLQIGANLERLTSVENTRTSAWAAQLSAIAENPWIGVGWDDTGATENSYLAGFAGYGIVMFLLLLAFLLFGIGLCAKLMLHRRSLPKHEKGLLDLVVGFHAMYFIGAAGEGYMLGRSSSIQTTMLIMGSIGMYLIHRARAIESGEVDLAEEYAQADFADHPEHQDHRSGEFAAPAAHGY